MFTGIVQAVGRVHSWDGQKLVVNPSTLDVSDLAIGESIAVNGCCLTVVPGDANQLTFDLSQETIQKTTFSDLKVDQAVNLERAMRPTDRFGGHIVQGHVDGVGKVTGKRPEGNAVLYHFSVPDGTFLIDKGSVTVDGVSLTVVSPKGGEFEAWIIPHTLVNTNLKELEIGCLVNIEFDVIAKYVQKLHKSYHSV